MIKRLAKITKTSKDNFKFKNCYSKEQEKKRKSQSLYRSRSIRKRLLTYYIVECIYLYTNKSNIILTTIKLFKDRNRNYNLKCWDYINIHIF